MENVNIPTEASKQFLRDADGNERLFAPASLATTPAEDKQPPPLTPLTPMPAEEKRPPTSTPLTSMPAEDKKPPLSASLVAIPVEDKQPPPPASLVVMPVENKRPPTPTSLAAMPVENKRPHTPNSLTSIPTEKKRRSTPLSLSSMPVENKQPPPPASLTSVPADNERLSVPASLTAMPAEVMNRMIQELDPVSLINLSLASEQFWNIIKPGHEEHVARLLVLECKKENGGAEPFINRRDLNAANDSSAHRQALDHPFDDARWAAQLFACGGCLEILPHYHFSNRSIQSEGFRKPMFGTPPVEPRTSWRPSPGGTDLKQVDGPASAQPKEPCPPDDDFDLRKYLAAFQALGLDFSTEINPEYARGEAFIRIQDWGRDMSEASVRALKKMFAEISRRGHDRRNRRCHECRFKATQLADYHILGASAGAVQNSRTVYCGNALGRFFPGYSNLYGEQYPPIPCLRASWFYNWMKFQEVWDMRMIRCPGCEIWQEIRAFRLIKAESGNGFKVKPGAFENEVGPKLPETEDEWDEWQHEREWEDAPCWIPTILEQQSLEECLCNRCFVKENGEDELKQALLLWLFHEQSKELARVEGLIKEGWGSINMVLRGTDPDYLNARRKLNDNHDYYAMGISSHMDPYVKLTTDSKMFFTSWYEALFPNDEARTFASCFDPASWHYHWLVNFKLLWRHWSHLTGMMRKVRDDPEPLVSWALDPQLGLPFYDKDVALDPKLSGSSKSSS
ncbi:unnamed protein product [Clonostachys rosea]|uniref:F-box domain-containing protein n=1 Tax=Bionectria ochroleuca TaxID=29856 RepID=A0ABY6UP07_BIOOC|nr:unnamed protein product [Clonostachys rosea]